MISFEEARAHVLDRCPRRPPETVPLDDALGCVLADDVVAPEAVPPFANSGMDGYAVRAADVAAATPEAPVRLTVAGTVAAGAAPTVTVTPGTAVRIMTGAPVPAGADTIVIVEASRRVDGADDRVDLFEAPEPGRHIRPAGDDLRVGDLVVAAGTRLGPAHLGVLATANVRAPRVHRRPRVGVLSTGDELIDDGRPLGPGQIRESNRPTLVAALRAWGCDPTDLGSVPDDADAIGHALTDAARHHDAVVSSGGVSMGDYDLVKTVLDEVADMTWMQVAIRPAKPFAFGLLDGVPVFGLPGNPVSSYVSLALLGLPGLRRLAARPDLDLPAVPARAGDAMPRRPDERTTYLRVVVTYDVDGPDGPGFVAHPVAAQGSHQLAATAAATGLAVLPPGPGVAAGDPVTVRLLRDPFLP